MKPEKQHEKRDDKAQRRAYEESVERGLAAAGLPPDKQREILKLVRKSDKP